MLIDRYNDLLCAVARRTSVDRDREQNPVYHLDLDVRNVIGEDCRDEIHPDAQGARRLGKMISEFIVSLLDAHRGKRPGDMDP